MVTQRWKEVEELSSQGMRPIDKKSITHKRNQKEPMCAELGAKRMKDKRFKMRMKRIQKPDYLGL